MILVDTTVWVRHIRLADATLQRLLNAQRVLTHPHIVGELALGNLPQRKTFLALLERLPAAVVATDEEVLRLIEDRGLAGSGVGYVDAHLLASSRLTTGSGLWTHDKRFEAVADYLGLSPDLR